MEKAKEYLLGQADKMTAWIGFIGICLQIFNFQSVMFLLFLALIMLPEAHFSGAFKKWTNQLRELDKK